MAKIISREKIQCIDLNQQTLVTFINAFPQETEYCFFMIKLMQEGNYKLIETRGQTKILILNKYMFAWVAAAEIGEILVTSHTSHKVDHILALGKYRLYEVKNEPHFTDLTHLELFVGEGRWQGYLLPTGVPGKGKKRARIIPTSEVITKSIH